MKWFLIQCSIAHWKVPEYDTGSCKLGFFIQHCWPRSKSQLISDGLQETSNSTAAESRHEHFPFGSLDLSCCCFEIGGHMFGLLGCDLRHQIEPPNFETCITKKYPVIHNLCCSKNRSVLLYPEILSAGHQ